MKDAAAAVQQEFQDSSRWKRLTCKKISIFAERDRGTVYVVHVGKSVEFDWTWEGARAFCPASRDDDSHAFVEQADEAEPSSRSAYIFYDNAQNVYDTKTPKWSEFGLDMRGRSTIMRESFRGTRQITELAVNVLHRLSGSHDRHDQQELISLGLLKPVKRNGSDWMEAAFSQIEGPKPIFHRFGRRSDEMAAIAGHLRQLIEIEGISPTDMCVVYNGGAGQILESQLAPKLAAFGVELSLQKNRSFERKSNTLLATTPHSYKGYESEVVVIPCVDLYVAPEGKLVASGLYVAMTRARSLLAMYGINGGSESSQKIVEVISACVETQRTAPRVDGGDEE